MSKGQTRVLVLLGVLLALEMMIQPTIKAFFAQGVYTLNSNLSSTFAPSGSSQSIAQQVQSKPDSRGNCPPGSVLSGGVCYNVKGV